MKPETLVYNCQNLKNNASGYVVVFVEKIELSFLLNSFLIIQEENFKLNMIAIKRS